MTTEGRATEDEIAEWWAVEGWDMGGGAVEVRVAEGWGGGRVSYESEAAANEDADAMRPHFVTA